jgi:ferredoxin
MMGTPLLHGRDTAGQGRQRHPRLRRQAEAVVPEAGPCIRCGNCTRACPMGLLPLEMAARIRAGELDAAVDFIAERLHFLRLLRLCLPFAHSAGAVLQPRQGRTGGARARQAAHRGRQTPGRGSHRPPRTRSEGKGRKRRPAQGRTRGGQGQGRGTARRRKPHEHSHRERRSRHRTRPPPNSAGRVMVIVMAALAPATLFGFWLYGWPAIHLWIITVASAMLGEAFCLRLMGRKASCRCCSTARRRSPAGCSPSRCRPGRHGGSAPSAACSPRCWPSRCSAASARTCSTRPWWRASRC